VRRHSIDPFSLVSGVVFAALGVLFMLTDVRLSTLHLQWVWPVPLIVLGVLIIALAGRPRSARRERDAD
jgi:uncharacterized membrane protein HdeD (DUF308 family)